MDIANRLLQQLTDGLGPYAPRLIGALTILAVAWIGARLARAAVVRLGGRTRLDERLNNPGMSVLLANVAGWAVWLFALPALLGALELKALLDPVNAMLSRMLGFLPNLFGAAVILAIGVVVAGILRQIVSGLLVAAGSEKIAARLGMAQALGKNTLAGIAGSILFALILLPTLAASLEALGLQSVSRPVSQLLDKVFELIPRVISAAIILGVSVLIGRALASVVSGLLAGMGINSLPARMGLTASGQESSFDAAAAAGKLVMLAVMFVALTEASEAIGFSVLTDAVASVGVVLARVAVAGLLLGAGLWLATVVARAIQSSSAANAPVLAHLARGAILFFAAALTLHQAGLPAEIVTIAFAAVVGAVAVALAIAVGVGGRHAAARLVDRAVQSFETRPAHDEPARRE